jgi:SAM-dependent methyltransferase
MIWKELYEGEGVASEMYRYRQTVVLDWIRGLALAPDAQVLEVGCGAGQLAVALAQQGFHVHAIDYAPAMIELAHRLAVEAGVTDRLTLSTGDACSLDFEQESFDLVIALGVINSLFPQPGKAIGEWERVTKIGGSVILASINSMELASLLDPLSSSLLRPLRILVRRILISLGLPHVEAPPWCPFSRSFIDRQLARAGLTKNKSMTLGFGDFTVLGCPLLPQSMGVRFNRWPQRKADSHMPLVHAMGRLYLVMAQKLL